MAITSTTDGEKKNKHSHLNIDLGHSEIERNKISCITSHSYKIAWSRPERRDLFRDFFSSCVYEYHPRLFLLSSFHLCDLSSAPETKIKHYKLSISNHYLIWLWNEPRIHGWRWTYITSAEKDLRGSLLFLKFLFGPWRRPELLFPIAALASLTILLASLVVASNK